MRSRLLGRHNDALESNLADAQSTFTEASSRYSSVVAGIGEVHTEVTRLGTVIGRIEGTSTDFQLPSLVRLPSVASGTSSRSTSGSTSSKPTGSKPAANPPPPPSNGSSGASGKP